MGSTRSLLIAAVTALAVLGCANTAFGARAAGTLDGQYIVLLESSAGDVGEATDDLQRKRGFRARLRFRKALRGFSARLSDQQVEDLQNDPAVASVTPDRPMRAFGEVDQAPGETAPSGIRRMGAATDRLARQASSARVAVLDTGIDLSHPDLNAVDGANCVAPGTPALDDDGHGTHIAGTISARNDGRGVVGVAPGTQTHAVKVLDGEGNGSSSQIICGIDWVTRTRTDGDPTNDISVVNLSLGGTGSAVGTCAGTRDPMHRAICASIRAGVTVVAAAGNEGRAFDNARTPELPAAYPEVLTVTAMSDSDGAPGAQAGAPTCRGGEADDARASFSNYATSSAGAAHTIAAPGVCIRSTWPGGGHATISGTSMASPHIAGAVALCLGEAGQAGPCARLSPAQVVARLQDVAGRQDAAYGFTGDPRHPLAGAYFGPLAWAGLADGGATGDPPVPTNPPAGSPASPVAAPPPAVQPATPAADRVAPLAVVSVGRQRLKTVLRRGLSLALRCSEGCVATVEVWLPGRTAKRVRLSRGARARIARRSGIRLAANTRKRIVLKLSRSARVRLARTRAVTATVKITVSDAAGNRRVLTRKVTLGR